MKKKWKKFEKNLVVSKKCIIFASNLKTTGVLIPNTPVLQSLLYKMKKKWKKFEKNLVVSKKSITFAPDFKNKQKVQWYETNFEIFVILNLNMTSEWMQIQYDVDIKVIFDVLINYI